MPVTIDGTNGITTPTYGGTDTSEYLVPVTAFKNRIINSAAGIWQRGTTIACASSAITYTTDRFAIRPNSSTNTTVTRSTSVPEGFLYSALVTRDSGQTGTLTRFQTALETNNMVDLRGQNVTISFYAKKDSGLTTSGSAIAVNLYVGNGVERLRGITAYDSETTPIADSATLTSDWQRFEFTSTALPSDLSQLTLEFSATWVGTAPSNDGFFVTGVQLEKGSTATSFDYRPYSTELALCQRYYYKLTTNSGQFGVGFNRSTTSTFAYISFPETMRTAPSALETTGLASDYRIAYLTAATVCSAVPAFQGATVDNAQTINTVASGLTAGQGSILSASSGIDAFLAWSAEL